MSYYCYYYLTVISIIHW